MSKFTTNFLKTLSLPKNFNLFVTFPRLKEEKTRSYTTFVMTLLAIIIFGFFAINPTLGTIIELNKQLADNKYVDQQFVEKIANLAVLQAKYSKLTNDIPIVLNALPTNPNIPTFLAQIQAVATDSNIQLARLQVQPVDISNIPQPVTGYLSFSFAVVATGTTDQASNFIDGISGFNRLITIDNISIAKDQPDDNSQSSGIRLNIKGRAYFKSLPL
jgi:Tfp pilus assembly protein PilO